MLEASKLRKNSVTSRGITFATNRAVVEGDCINPYEPFKGADGKSYIIGYEKRFNKVTNCYAFAMGWQVAANNKYDDYVPGFLCGQPYSVANCAKLVKADLEAVGRKVYEILYDIPEELPDRDGYWIKFLYCPKKGDLDAHFMRKDKKSGRWIHKMGWVMPPKVCEKKLELKNKKEMLMEMPELKGYTREMIDFVLPMMFPQEMYAGMDVVRSTHETDDSADYVAIPEDGIPITYKAMWVMRISEP